MDGGHKYYSSDFSQSHTTSLLTLMKILMLAGIANAVQVFIRCFMAISFTVIILSKLTVVLKIEELNLIFWSLCCCKTFFPLAVNWLEFSKCSRFNVPHKILTCYVHFHTKNVALKEKLLYHIWLVNWNVKHLLIG